MGGDEAELVAAWQRGDRRAGDVILRRHLDALRRFLRRKAGPTEDLVQETLLQCLRSIGSFRGEARFRTFLLAIASNVQRKHARSIGRAHFPHEAAAKEDLAGGSLDLDARLDGERIFAALDDGLALLPEHARRVIRLQYWDELTSGQIASLLAVPAGSVRRWQTLARRKLARSMRLDLNRFNRYSRSKLCQRNGLLCEHSANSGD